MKSKNFMKVWKYAFMLTLILAGMAFNGKVVKAADGEIKAVTIKTGKEGLDNNNYTGKLSAVGDDGYVRGSVIKVTTDCSGLLRFHYQGNNSDIVSITVYSDEGLTKDIAYTSLNASSKTEISMGLSIPKAGTYYASVRTFEEEDIDFTIAADIYSSDDDSLTEGKSKLVTLLSNKDSNFYKITLKSQGIVKVYTTYANGKKCYADVDIYEAAGGKRKLVSKGASLAEGSVNGLAQGTYYIKLSNGSDSYYSIKYKFTAINDKSGAKKTKAASLKLGTGSKGLILAKDSTSKEDWYKITLNKAQHVTITYTGDVTGDVTLSFYDSENYLFGKLYIDEYTAKDSAIPYVGNGNSKKLPKGTYYVKVTKDGSSTSGAYSIKIQ